MGGMAVLEWPLCSPAGYIHHIVPIATSARHSAWCISWGEAQRQSIYSDPLYLDGYYDTISGQPKTGLAAARMAALLTYRSRDSFESRFGRKTQLKPGVLTPPRTPSTAADNALAAHNDGHRSSRQAVPSSASSSRPTTPPPTKVFTAQSYLRYQGDKFTSRFDANCYIHLSRKMDTHDVTRDRSNFMFSSSTTSSDNEEISLPKILGTIPPHALVISIQTDGLFTPSEQYELASYIPHAQLVTIPSPDGHDGFLLEFESINGYILGFLKERFPRLYESSVLVGPEDDLEVFTVKKTSKFGEAETDIAQW